MDDIALSCLTSILDNSYDKYHQIDEVENLNVLAGVGWNPRVPHPRVPSGLSGQTSTTK